MRSLSVVLNFLKVNQLGLYLNFIPSLIDNLAQEQAAFGTSRAHLFGLCLDNHPLNHFVAGIPLAQRLEYKLWKNHKCFHVVFILAKSVLMTFFHERSIVDELFLLTSTVEGWSIASEGDVVDPRVPELFLHHKARVFKLEVRTHGLLNVSVVVDHGQDWVTLLKNILRCEPNHPYYRILCLLVKLKVKVAILGCFKKLLSRNLCLFIEVIRAQFENRDEVLQLLRT